MAKRKQITLKERARRMALSIAQFTVFLLEDAEPVRRNVRAKPESKEAPKTPKNRRVKKVKPVREQLDAQRASFPKA